MGGTCGGTEVEEEDLVCWSHGVASHRMGCPCYSTAEPQGPCHHQLYIKSTQWPANERGHTWGEKVHSCTATVGGQALSGPPPREPQVGTPFNMHLPFLSLPNSVWCCATPLIFRVCARFFVRGVSLCLVEWFRVCVARPVSWVPSVPPFVYSTPLEGAIQCGGRHRVSRGRGGGGVA